MRRSTWPRRSRGCASWRARSASAPTPRRWWRRFAPGAHHRFLVIGDRVVAAARRDSAQVVGDGKQTIAELVERVNRDPRRGDDASSPLRKVRLDEPVAVGVLAEQGYTPESIPP